MRKGKVLFAVITVVILIGILLGVLLPWQSKNRSSPEQAQETGTAANLGIIYLTVTPGLSAYYNLGVDSGALVTEVVPNSPADKAGVKVGDVIISFNGTRVEQGTSLLGIMRTCLTGDRISLEIWRAKSSQTVEFVHALD